MLKAALVQGVSKAPVIKPTCRKHVQGIEIIEGLPIHYNH